MHPPEADLPRTDSTAVETETGQSQHPSTRGVVLGVIWVQIAANLSGAVLAAVSLNLLFPPGSEGGINAERLRLWPFAIYVMTTLLVGLPAATLLMRRGITWLADRRPPTEPERNLALGLPLRQACISLLVWGGGAVVFRASGERGRVPLGIALAGLVVAALVYLLLERILRPVFRAALEGASLGESRREILPKLTVFWLVGTAIPLVAAAVAPLAAPGPASPSVWKLSAVVLMSVLVGGIVMRIAAASVAQPINRVRTALSQVERGDLSIELPVEDRGELGRLAAGVNSMVAGLRERERLHDLFGRQVGREVAEWALGHLEPGPGAARAVTDPDGPLLPPGSGADLGEERDVTVLFVDISGYTSYAEHHSPGEVVHMLNRFFQTVQRVIDAEGGWINKFEGDAALCVFGAPADQPDHAARGLRAAQRLATEINLPLTPTHPNTLQPPPTGPAPTGPPVLGVGIGVASGPVLAGIVGSAERYEYTVIGDIVNVAARLCDLGKTRAFGVLAAQSSIDDAGLATATTAKIDWLPLGPVDIRGRSSRLEVWELGAWAPLNPRDRIP